MKRKVFFAGNTGQASREQMTLRRGVRRRLLTFGLVVEHGPSNPIEKTYLPIYRERIK